MEGKRLDLRFHHSASTQSVESAFDLDKNGYNHLKTASSPPLQLFPSGGQHPETTSAAYFSWPTSSRLNDSAEDRANYFANLQKGVLPETFDGLPTGKKATTLLELMMIRAFHSKNLRRFSLGTAIGFRIRRGVLTNIAAILVFVARKVHKQWLNPLQCLPTALEVTCVLTFRLHDCSLNHLLLVITSIGLLVLLAFSNVHVTNLGHNL